ncbi:DUF4430 domain-containing protein [Alicyclobacillus ferrooxydans]|uniref:DUF4430 domain-containing protein n=1 Tax=Alicyclobacillus ferrooxydans TaxID=471514 RepID=UPI0014708426|nr:DUF4430 domain-containing protein [Alicyclobacillus ferrooxydans]
MRKTWARLVLIVAVVCAVGVGWIYHQRASASASSHWLTALANQTAVSTNNSAAVTASSTVGANAQPTNTQLTNTANPSTGKTGQSGQTGNETKAGDPSAASNMSQSSGNGTTSHQTTSSASDAARAAATGTKSSGTGTGKVNETAHQPTRSTNSTNTSASTDPSKTSSAPAKSGTTNSTSVSNTTQNSGSFTVIVSENHGQTVLEKKVISIHPGENLMQYMEQNFQIGTAYGGAYITSIDGIKSQWTGVPVDQRKPVDWFLYINTQEAPVGAESIVPRKGDVDDWDYHSWNPSTGQG